MRGWVLAIVIGLTVSPLAGACDSGGSEADRRGVGAECARDADCTEEGQRCLTEFKGGYCGVKACTVDADCPAGSACVTHDDGVNYCFLTCAAKADCNVNRSADYASNCAASVTWAEQDHGKACVPPSGND